MNQAQDVNAKKIELAKKLYEGNEMRHFKAVAWSIALDKVHHWNLSIFKKFENIGTTDEFTQEFHVSQSAKKVSEVS